MCNDRVLENVGLCEIFEKSRSNHLVPQAHLRHMAKDENLTPGLKPSEPIANFSSRNYQPQR